MRARFLAWGALVGGAAIVSIAWLAACGSGTTDPDPLGGGGGGGSADANINSAFLDGSDDAGPRSGRVFANTRDALYLFEPFTQKLTLVGRFSCLAAGEIMSDVAVDRAGAMYGVSARRLFSIDPISASCAKIADASGTDDYPSSLSFVPTGSVDKTKEALVGYASPAGVNVADRYVRIDTQTGAMSVVGGLNPAGAATKYRASGDIVSLSKDGMRTFLTVKVVSDGGVGTDLLAEVDPVGGSVKRVVGDTKQNDILGLGYWSGKGYGFAGTGLLLSIDMGTGLAVVITGLSDNGTPVPWSGAGVTTEVPLTP